MKISSSKQITKQRRLMINKRKKSQRFNIFYIWKRRRTNRFFERFYNDIFYQEFWNVYDILNFIYLKFNRVRDARRDFEVLKIKLEQIFNIFYSKFTKLINQLIDYFEQIKINCFENKFTLKFLQIMTINEIFIFLHFLKKYFLNINNRLNNIYYEKIKKNNKDKTRFIKKFSRNVFSRSTSILKRFENRRVIFKNLTQIINTIKTRMKQKNCY